MKLLHKRKKKHKYAYIPVQDLYWNLLLILKEDIQ
jgi:hypothetical protein